MAESFFRSLKKGRIKRKIYATTEEAKSEIFEYIEVFYNHKRRHSRLNQLIPMIFEGYKIETNKRLRYSGKFRV